MPPFLSSLQTRLQALFGKLAQSWSSLRARLQHGGLRASLGSVAGGKNHRFVDLQQFLRIDVERLGTGVGYLLVLTSCLIVTFLILKIWQLPYPSFSDTSASKGMTLYTSRNIEGSYALFGSKPLELNSIVLRGVVITGKTDSGKETGFALLEIDGKASGAVSLGENLGKGLTLQAIHPEGVTLVHQGQKIELSLQRTPTRSSAKTNLAPTKTSPSASNPTPGASPSTPTVSESKPTN